jgi:uncharacterized protein YbjT (DUF2867 family)
MSERTYVVLGATGHVGSIVASRLLDSGKRVRVVARSTGKLEPLAARGAEAVPGTVDDRIFLRRAFDGADVAFVLLPPRPEPGFRAWQDRTANAIGDALEGAEVRYAVVLSSIGADLPRGNGPVAGLHTLERRLDRIGGLRPLYLRPGFFFENYVGSAGLIRSMGVHGGAFRPDLKLPCIASRDIGEFAARKMLSLDWRERTIQELHGERDLTPAETAGALGKAIGRPGLTYVQFPYDAAIQGMIQMGVIDELAELYAEMARAFNEGTVAPRQPRTPISTTHTSIERWAADVFAPVYAASERPSTEATSHA